jgi:hypothetical protein
VGLTPAGVGELNERLLREAAGWLGPLFREALRRCDRQRLEEIRQKLKADRQRRKGAKRAA